MFSLTTHSTLIIYGYNGIRRMVKDRSGSERGNSLLALHGLRFLLAARTPFIFSI